MSELELREAICEVGRRMYARNLVAATDGNISIRLDRDRYLCTPSAVSKGFMEPDDIVVADAQGRKVSGYGTVTSEFSTHLAAYEERPGIVAVVHAHPPKAIGCTLAGISLADPVLPEVICTLGGIPTAEYATPATPEGAEALRPLIRECDAVMLDRHGSITVGKSVIDAYLKLEKIEHAAEALITAHILGHVRELSESDLEKLRGVAAGYGGAGRLFGADSR